MQQRSASAQCTSARYGNAVAVPLDVDAARRRGRATWSVDVGVVGAGGRIARPASGWRRRVGRIADVPALDRRDVDAAGGDRVAVRAPPVAAEAAHLLGGDEVGAAPRDVGIVGASPASTQLAAVELADAQRAPADVGDAARRRVGPRIEHRPVDIEQLAGRAGEQSGRRTAGRRAAKATAAVLASVANAVMPPARLAGPLAPGPLLAAAGRRRTDRRRRAARRGSATSRSSPVSTSSDPQAVDGIVAGPRCAGTRRAGRRATRSGCVARRG